MNRISKQKLFQQKSMGFPVEVIITHKAHIITLLDKNNGCQ